MNTPADRHNHLQTALTPACDSALRAIAPGGIVLITGPSGAGKSTLLTLLRARLRTAREINPAQQLRHIRSPICTLSREPLDAWLARLARFGLAEAMLWLQRPGELSAGQRWRLAFALRMVGSRPTLICDEACALLDRMTAISLCMNLRREVTGSPGTRLIMATSHDDLHTGLRPDVHVQLTLTGRVRVTLLAPPRGKRLDAA